MMGPGLPPGVRPDITDALIALNIVAFIYLLFLGGLDRDIFFYKYGLIASELTSGESIETLNFLTPRGVVPVDVSSPIPAWGTVFTSMFVHGGVLHILANMLFLYGFGGYVEHKLGHVRYLIFYLAVGVAAAWTQVATDLDSRVPLIGASGAISGVVAAYLLAFPYRHSAALALLFMLVILPLILDVGSVSPVGSGTGIAYMAHLGGLVAGGLLMAGFKFMKKEPILQGVRWPPWRRWR